VSASLFIQRLAMGLKENLNCFTIRAFFPQTMLVVVRVTRCETKRVFILGFYLLVMIINTRNCEYK